MAFPSMEWAERWREICNSSNEFAVATRWADTKIVFEFGCVKYWMKLYKGMIIDLNEYLPTWSPMGYDFVVRGEEDVWNSIRHNNRRFWDCLNSGDVLIDGNLVEAHRFHESILIMCQDILPYVD